MANANRPDGAAPRGVPLRVNKYIAGGIIKPGDPCTMDSSGRAVVATASQALCGIAANYASAAGQEVEIYDHPDQLFVAQASAAQIAAQTNLGLNYDIVASNSSTKISNAQIDSSTGATTATLPLKVLNLSDEVGNAFGANVRCVFKINNHQFAAGTGTAGV